MSDKKWSRLNPLDRALRELHPIQGFTRPHTRVTIELRQGFELFNTRPYHNYETWSDGYYITDLNGIQGRGEDLDQAVEDYVKNVGKARTRDEAD